MYRSRGFISSEVGDVEVFPHGDTLHLFHLTLPNHDVVAHAISSDGLAWQALPPALYTGAPGACDDDMIWTMSVTEHEGAFYMLYTALARAEDGRTQRTGLAVSSDLIHWQKHPHNPVAEADPRWYDTDRMENFWQSWRDPKPIWVGDRYYAAVCARQKDGPRLRRGVVGLFSSADMQQWQVEAPLFAPHHYHDLECPQVFKIGRYYYLTAAIMEDHSQRYWIAEEFRGPYWTPPNNRLAPPGHYAARVCHWHGQDLLFCWHRSLKPGVTESDSSIRYIPAPLVLQQATDSSLSCGSWPLWADYQAGQAMPLPHGEPRPLCHNPTASHAGETMQVEQGLEIWALSEPTRDFMLEGDLALPGAGGGLAFALDETATGYFVEFLPGEHRVRLVKWLPRRRDDGSPWFSYEVMHEVPLTPRGERIRVSLLVVGGEVELAVDGQVALSAAAHTRIEGQIGVFAVCGQVSLQNASLNPMRVPQHS